MEAVSRGSQIMKRQTWMSRAKRAALVCTSASVMQVSLCTGEAGVEFRTAAGSSIKSGVLSIVNGAVEGLFAIIEPEATTAE